MTDFDRAVAEKERVERIPKRPHKVLVDHWDQRLDHLQRYISGQKKQVDQLTGEQFAGLEDNLFVDAE